MVRRLIALVGREIRGLHEAAYLLAVFAVFSQILALLRDRTFAHVFGAGAELDIYFAAFRVPDLLFAFLTMFVSSFALVPLFALHTAEKRHAYIATVLILFGIIALLGSAVLFFLIPFIMPYLLPGFSATALTDTILLAQIMLLQPVFLGLSSIASAWMQATRRFFLFALAPVFYNVGIICGVLFFYPALGLAGLAWGVVLGAVLHAGIQGFVLVESISTPRRLIPFGEIIESVVVPSVPRALALMSHQSLLVAFATVASLVSAGAIAAQSLAWNLQSVALTVLAVPYASALFPALAALTAVEHRSAFREKLWTTVRHLAFWLLPATMFVIVLRAHMVRVVLGSGAFSWDDTRLTAAVVALFALSLLAQGIVLVASRAFYAAEKPLVPIFLNIGSALVAGALAYVLVASTATHPFALYFVESLLRVSDVPGTLVLMIPVAYSIVFTITAVLFCVYAARAFGYDSSVTASLGISCSASVLGAVATYGALQAFGPLLPTNTFIGILTQGALAGGVGVLLWLCVLWFMRSQELAEITGMIRARLYHA